MTVALKSATDATAKSRSPRFWWVVAWAGVAAGIAFRVCHLGRESLWFDEGYSAWMVSHSPGEIIRLIRADTAPPLFYLLLHGWTEVFGRSEWALRSLSTLLSIFTMFIALDIARRMLRNPAAIAAAAWAMSLSFLQFWFAREARAYALMGFCGVAAFDCLLRHLAQRRRRWPVPMALLIAAAMYTHNMMAPYVAGLLIAWMVLPSEHSPRRRLAEMAAVVGAAIALYLPWAIGGLPAQLQMIQHAFWVDPLRGGDFFSALAALAGVKQYWYWAEVLDRIHITIGNGARPAGATGVLLLGSAILSIGFQGGARRREALGLLAMAMFPPVAVALYSVLRTPLFTEKLFLPTATLLPIFALLPLGMRVPQRIRRATWSGAVLLLLLSGLTLYGSYSQDDKENWRQIAKVISQMPTERRLIVFAANDGQLPFDYYYRYRPGDEATGVPSGFFDLNPPRTMRRVLHDDDLKPLEDRLDSGHYDQIVLVIAHIGWGDPGHLTEALLDSRFAPAGDAEVNDLSLRWYESARSPQ